MGTQTNKKYGLAVLAALMFSASSALAQTLTWSGNALWDDTTLQWNNNTVPWSDYAIAQFDTAGSVDLGVNVTASGLVFNGQTILGPGSGPFTLTLAGDIGGSSPIVNVSADTTISAVIAGTDGFTKTGAGTLTLSGVNTFTGTLAIKGGILSVGSLPLDGTSASSIGKATQILLDGGALHYTNLPYAGNLLRTRTVTIGANGGTILSDSTNGPVFSGTITNPGSDMRTLTFGGDGGGSWSGAINGAISIVKTGGGSWTISGAKNYTGDTTINEGTLRIGGTNNSLPTTTTLIINRDAAFNLNGNYSQTVAVLQDGVNGGGRIHNNYSSSTSGTMTIGAGSFSGTICNGNSVATYTDRFVAVVKTGTGTLRLSGTANTYGGGTLIEGGTLLVNSVAGNGLGLSDVRVTTGGTLGGHGYLNLTKSTYSGTLTVASGGAISPGDSAINSGLGALTIAATKLIMEDGSALSFTLGAGDASSALQFYNYTGAADFQRLGDITLNFTGATEGDFDLFKFYTNAGTTLTDSGFSELTSKFVIGSGLSGYDAQWDYSTTGIISLHVTQIPEPSVWLLLTVGAVSLTLTTLRRRRAERL